MAARDASSALERFHPTVRAWFSNAFQAPTPAQALGWPAIHAGESTLLLAPTGSGKTLAAFLSCIDRLMFAPEPARKERLRAVYVSPLKALAVDVDRNLRAPLEGIARVDDARGAPRALPRAARGCGRAPPPAHRPLRHAAAAGRGGEIPGRGRGRQGE